MKTQARSVFRQAIPFQVLVLSIYVWYLTTGLWTSLPKTFATDLYDQLGTAFRKGQLFLDRRPAADLLALRDPFVVQQRKHVSSYIGDATLYGGKYYLYWGPVPALLLTAIKPTLYAGRIGDEVLVLVFVSGTFMLASTLLVNLWRRHFGDVPRWAVLAAIPLVGLITPFTWVLNHPLIYEAALASAAMFFMGGISCTYLALRQRPAPAPILFLAGLSWALAIGSQFTQILPVATVLVLSTARLGLGWSWRRRSLFLRIGLLWAPVALTLLGLAWYNRARFGSALEFGYRYQLAVVNLHEHYREIFSPLYGVPNIHNYVLNPFRMHGEFPFLMPQYGSVLADPSFGPSRIYYTEAITGLAFAAPFLAYALVPLIAGAKSLWHSSRWQSAKPADSSLVWLVWSLLCAAGVQLAALLLFFYSAPRYLMPVMSALSILSVLGFWQAYRALAMHATAQKLNTLAAVLVGLGTIVASSLLAISSSQDRFLEGNPDLLRQINSLFH
jgi:hypothetical protein